MSPVSGSTVRQADRQTNRYREDMERNMEHCMCTDDAASDQDDL